MFNSKWKNGLSSSTLILSQRVTEQGKIQIRDMKDMLFWITEANMFRDDHVFWIKHQFLLMKTKPCSPCSPCSPRPVLQIRFAVSGGKSTLKPGDIYERDKMGSKGIWVNRTHSLLCKPSENLSRRPCLEDVLSLWILYTGLFIDVMN